MSRKNRTSEAQLKTDALKRVKTLTRNLTIYKLHRSCLSYGDIRNNWSEWFPNDKQLTRARIGCIYLQVQRLLTIDNGYQNMIDLISIN